jgi:hypothetical protein
LETATGDGIENGWLLVSAGGAPSVIGDAPNVEPTAIEVTDEADDTGRTGGGELRTSDNEFA